MAGNDRRKKMANQEHLTILKQGITTWNMWRKQHPEIQPDLTRANLSEADLLQANLSQVDLRDASLRQADLRAADLSQANLIDADLRAADLSQADLRAAHLSGAHLNGADLSQADLSGANLSGAILFQAKLYEANLRADLSGADLKWADLREANLSGAILSRAKLYEADLRAADLSEATLIDADLRAANLRAANLSEAILVGTNFTDAILTGCHIYGIAAWNVELTGATQDNLVITPEVEPTITVDHLKIAQFIYLLLNNQEIRDVIDTIAKKAVLILGHFTPERKAILDALRDELRKHDYLPILFDFDKPNSRNLTETVSTLAHLSRFIVADLTDPSSIPQELYAIVPTLTVPVQPLLEASKREYSMFSDFKRYHWVLPIHHYTNLPGLLQSLQEQIIQTAEQKAKELEEQS